MAYERDKFHSGTDYSAYKYMGAHISRENGVSGVRFTLWAPNARSCSVLSGKTDWTGESGKMTRADDGVWELFVPHMRASFFPFRRSSRFCPTTRSMSGHSEPKE